MAPTQFNRKREWFFYIDQINTNLPNNNVLVNDNLEISGNLIIQTVANNSYPNALYYDPGTGVIGYDLSGGSGGGSWVGTATSDLDMSTYNITNTGGYNTYQTLGTNKIINTPSNTLKVGGVNVTAINKRTRTSHASAVKCVSTWTTQTSAADNGWRSVCWAAELGLFCAVADTGTGNRVMTSPDGITWTLQTSAVDNSWRSICWAPELGLFCAVAESGIGNRVMTSPNGITWTTRTSAADNEWCSVCWAAELGLFCAVASSGTNNDIMTSPDGITWTIRTSAADNFWTSVCWAAELGLFCVVSWSGLANRVMTSSDGITWTTRTSGADNLWNSVCWAAELGLFCAVAESGVGNRVMTSPDGITWTTQTSAADNSWGSVCWAAELGIFCAVADTGTGNRVMTSHDGINWTTRTSAADNNWRSVCWAPELSLFCAISNSGTGNRVMTTKYKIFTSKNIQYASEWVGTATSDLNMSNFNITNISELRGASTMILDPAAVGDNTGLVIIKGGLQVDGSSTIINSSILDISDHTILLASAATNVTQTYGAGIEISGNKTFTYESGDIWNSNIGITAPKFTGDICANALSVNSSYILPTTIGTANQVLTVPASGNVLTFTTPTSSWVGTATSDLNMETYNITTTSGYSTYQSLGTNKIINTPSNTLKVGGVNISAINKRTRTSHASAVKCVSTWITQTSAADNAWLSVCWAPELGLFCAVAESGTGNRVMTSPDGITWTIRTSAANNGWFSVCWAAELGLFCAVANTGTGNRVMTSPDGITWTIRTSAADNAWRSVCWAAELGLFCAVGESGVGNRVMTSPDGITWTTQTSAADNNWINVCWAAELGLFCAVGVGNRVMTSPNGITWTQTSSPNSVWIDVCWAPELGLFCAVSQSGTANRVMTSPNGITWTTRTSAADNEWRSVCWAPELGLFCAVARIGIGNRVMTSPDGINWTTRTSAADNAWRSVCWAAELGLFCAVANSGTGNRVMTTKYKIFTSKNIQYANTNSFYVKPIRNAAGTYGLFYDSGTGEITYNTSGGFWVGTATSDLSMATYNITTTSGYSTYQSLGTNKIINTPSNTLKVGGVNISAINKRTRTSHASAVKCVSTWITQTSAADNNLNSVCWAPELGLFCAVAESGIGNRVMTSPDGITWTTRTSAADNSWRSVCWAAELGLFCAVAYSGQVMTSPDGITWTTRTSAADNAWRSVCWAAELGLFCAVGESGVGNRVMTSPDGITWTTQTSAADNNWINVCWAAELGLFCAVAASGVGNRVMTSPNGITWTQTSSPDNQWIDVCWAPELGLFCAVSQSGTANRVMTSPNGITWTTRTSAADNEWRSVCWAPELGLFCAVARTGIGNRVMTSPDGINWTTRTSAADNFWNSVCWAPELGIFCAVSYTGTGNRVMTTQYKIYTSNKIETISITGTSSIISNNAISAGGSSVSLGLNCIAGPTGVTIGRESGNASANFSYNIGYQAGSSGGNNSIAFGYRSRRQSSGINAVALGSDSGYTGQKDYAVAIGNLAGYSNQSAYSVAIGPDAGNTRQGQDCIAIGRQAGRYDQSANTIILNASGTEFNGKHYSGFYVKPIRNATGTYGLYYDSGTGEITYNTAGSSWVGTATTDLDMANYNITNISELRGASTITIDPAGIGDNTGLVVIKGNLQVDGTTTTINSSILDISDHTILLASNATATSQTYGAGLEISGNKTFTYESGDIWSSNIGITAPKFTGDISASALTVNSAYQMPTTIGSANQVLTVPASGNTLTFTTPSTDISGFTLYSSNSTENSIGDNSVLLGYNVGSGYSNRINQTCIGYNAGGYESNDGVVAIGAYAGNLYLKNYSIAIGYKAAENSAFVGGNCITLNATGLSLNNFYAGSFCVKPIRGPNTYSNILYYDIDSGEITYNTLISSWVETATSDLNMNGYKITNIQDISVNNNLDIVGNVIANKFTGDISASALTVNSAYQMPTTIGSANQILTVPASGNVLEFTTPSSGGATSIINTQTLISSNTGTTTTGDYSVVLGHNCNLPTSGTNIIIGRDSGNTSAYSSMVTLGYQNCQSGGNAAVAIGDNAGRTNCGAYAVAIGYIAGQASIGQRAIAIGRAAGQNNLSNNSIAIGNEAAQFNAQTGAIAIGDNAGKNNLKQGSIAIGSNTAYFDSGIRSVYIGDSAGNSVIDNGDNAICIGQSAGNYKHRTKCVCIGLNAGANYIGQYSIAIGTNAARNSAQTITDYSGCIVLNAQNNGDELNPTQGGQFLVKPIRNDATPTDVLFYNTSSGEITYGDEGQVSSDMRLKTNIEDVTITSLDIIKQLQIKKFIKCSTLYPSEEEILRGKLQIGVIAQEIMKINPELVSGGDEIDSNGNLIEKPYFIKFNDLAMYHIKATQELTKELDLANNKIQELETQNNILKSAINSLLKKNKMPLI